MGFLDRAKDKIRNMSDEDVRVMDADEEEFEYEKYEEPDPAAEKKPKKSFVNFKKKKKPEPIFEPENDFVDDSQTVNLSSSKVLDVLEVLGIQPTFDIEKDVFLPDEMEDVSFDLETPFGYDQGQVDGFLNKSKVSVKRYVELLTQRNEDIAKIATVVDKLQVDLHNMKYESEISNGINIMPTNDADVENELMEAKLKIRKLEDTVKSLKKQNQNIQEHNSGGLTENERKKFDSLQDELSVMKRENENLRNEIYSLKNQVAYYEENADYVATEDSTKSAFDLEDDYDAFENTSITRSSGDDSLPVFENDMIPKPKKETKKNKLGGAFDIDDDDDIFAGFGSTDDSDVSEINFSDDSGSDSGFYFDEDDDDIVDKVMKSL